MSQNFTFPNAYAFLLSYDFSSLFCVICFPCLTVLCTTWDTIVFHCAILVLYNNNKADLE